jgi:hypothetical protein
LRPCIHKASPSYLQLAILPKRSDSQPIDIIPPYPPKGGRKKRKKEKEVIFMKHIYTKGKKVRDLYAYMVSKYGKAVVWSWNVDVLCDNIQDELENGDLWSK